MRTSFEHENKTIALITMKDLNPWVTDRKVVGVFHDIQIRGNHHFELLGEFKHENGNDLKLEALEIIRTSQTNSAHT